MLHRRALSLLASLLLACGGSTPATPTDAGRDAGARDAGPPDGGAPPPFALTSSAYAAGAMIPVRYECGPPVVMDGPGENVTPPLAWTAGPAATMSYAIVMRDRDAGNLVHWVVYNIAASTREIAEDVPAGFIAAFPEGARQAELQMSGYFGYLGPCSPGRVNTYEITVHAMPTATLPFDRTTTEDSAAAMIEAMSIASATLSGES